MFGFGSARLLLEATIEKSSSLSHFIFFSGTHLMEDDTVTASRYNGHAVASFQFKIVIVSLYSFNTIIGFVFKMQRCEISQNRRNENINIKIFN